MPGLVRRGGGWGLGGLVLAIGLPDVPGAWMLVRAARHPKPALTWRRMPSISLAPGS